MCDVSGEQSHDARLILTQKMTGEILKAVSLEPALLECLMRWGVRVLVKGKLTDIDCDLGKRHQNSGLVGPGGKAERRWKYSCWGPFYSQIRAVFEVRISQ